MSISVMNILFAASECAPLAKVGGLGDVVGSLPKALRELGIDARVILPMYKNLPAADAVPAGKDLMINFDDKILVVKVLKTNLPGGSVAVYLLKEPSMFGRGDVYESKDAGPGGSAEIKKFLFFCLCVSEFLKQRVWEPDLLHLHDWHVSLTPLLMKLDKIGVPTLLTIHNLAMQGLAGKDQAADIHPALLNQPSVRQDLFNYKKINLLRQGILHAAAVSTVSEAYAREITTPEFGENLENDLKSLAPIHGILNGIDYAAWNESNDPFIAERYDSFHSGLKLQNKSALQKQLGLKTDLQAPLFGIVSRLTSQKGFNLLEPIWERLETLDFQMVILGVGEKAVEKFFDDVCARHPERFTIQKKFDERLAHRIYAASDIFLMPSRFEPCGLGQMIAMHYGSVPVVRATGGLKDSVVSLNGNLGNPKTATGFSFSEFNPAALLQIISQAVKIYKQRPATWHALVRNAMAADFSWQKSSEKYRDLYQQIINA